MRTNAITQSTREGITHLPHTTHLQLCAPYASVIDPPPRPAHSQAIAATSSCRTYSSTHRLSEYLAFGLILVRIAVPTNTVLILAIFYSCISVILPALIRQPPALPKQAPLFASTNLFWSSLVVLILPHCLHGLSFLLHAWSCHVYDLSDCISIQSAATAFAIECILLSVPYLTQLYVLPLKMK